MTHKPEDSDKLSSDSNVHWSWAPVKENTGYVITTYIHYYSHGPGIYSTAHSINKHQALGSKPSTTKIMVRN